MKTCSKCKEPKDESRFYRNPQKRGGGLRAICKDCHAVQVKANDWRSRNLERARKSAREWHRANPGRIKEIERSPEVRAYRTKYKTENIGKIKEQSAAYYQANKAEIDSRNMGWAKQNRPKSRVIHDRWKSKNPEKISAYDRAKRAKRMAAPGSHTPEEALEILERQNYRCANPKCSVDLKSSDRQLDHKEPLSRGGSDSAENLQWLCRPCNARKHAKPYAEWLTSVTEKEAAQ